MDAETRELLLKSLGERTLISRTIFDDEEHSPRRRAISGLADYRRNKRKLYEEFARCQTLYGEVCEAYFEKRKNAKTELVFSEYM